MNAAEPHGASPTITSGAPRPRLRVVGEGETGPKVDADAMLGQFIPLHYHGQMLATESRVSAFRESIARLVPIGGVALDPPICGSREMARQRRERERGSSLPRSRQGPMGGGSVGVQRACGRHRARRRPRRTGTLVPPVRAPAVQSGAPVDAAGWPRGRSPSQAEAKRRDAPRDDAGAIFIAPFELDSAASVSMTALVGRVRAALAAARGGGPAWAGEDWGDADVAARQEEEEAECEEARRSVAVRGERRGDVARARRRRQRQRQRQRQRRA